MDVDALTKLIGLVKGSPTTTKSTTTSAAGTQALLNNILQSNQGLATVASGQKSAGLYNSTVNQQMLNDLLARSAAQVESQNSTTTVKTAPTVTGKDLLTMAAVMGVKALLGPSVSTGAKKAGMDQWGQKISDTIFGKSEVQSPDQNLAAADAPVTEASWSDMGNSAISGVTDAVGADTSGLLDTASLFGSAESSGLDFSGDTSGAFSADVASNMSSDYGASADTGLDISSMLGSSDSGGAGGEGSIWIVCTELNRQHRLPNRFYVYGAKEFANYREDGKRGYYVWAIPTVRHLRKYPYSQFSKFICTIFNWRAEYLAAKAGCPKARKLVRGWFITVSSYYLCLAISKFVPEQNWRSVYDFPNN